MLLEIRHLQHKIYEGECQIVERTGIEAIEKLDKKEHKTLVCIPLSPVFSRHSRGLPNFMDEPTSNLDSLNEGIILKSLKESAEEKTVVLVSHRKSTMNVADVVYEMD